MERILPEEHENYIITPFESNCEKRMCVCELGILGISIGYILFFKCLYKIMVQIDKTL
jgi:hypothetical protein